MLLKTRKTRHHILDGKRNDYELACKARLWPLIEMTARYYDFKKPDGCSPSFLSSIKRHLQHFMLWLKRQGFDPNQNRPEELTSMLLAGYRQMLAENESISLLTANQYIDHVRMLLLWGWQMHGITHPPIGSIKKFSYRKNAKNGHGRKQCREPLSWDELERLFSAADITNTALLMLGLNCGFGNMDIGTLKLCDIDLENGMVSHPRVKTGVERHFNLWPETVQILKIYLAEHRGKPANEEIGTLVFVGKRGNSLCWEKIDGDGRLKRSDAVRNRFQRLFEKAGSDRKYGIGFYVLRHTYATVIGSQSNDLREVQAALGQLTFTQRETYRHDRQVKSISAQKKVRQQLLKTSIPQILQCKHSEAEIGEELPVDKNLLCKHNQQ